jgi:hypothetical protein
MNHYKFTRGAYSDYSEYWYTHERKMNAEEMKTLLRDYWPEIEKRAKVLVDARKADALATFGGDDPVWQYEAGITQGWDKSKQLRGTREALDAWFVRHDTPLVEEIGSSLFSKLLEAAGFVEVVEDATLDMPDGYELSSIVDEVNNILKVGKEK